MENIIENLKKHFTIKEIKKQRDDLFFIIIDKKEIVLILNYMKDSLNFKHFVLLTAIDWIEDGNFQLTYILKNRIKKIEIGIKIFVDRDNPIVESADKLWKQVATYQRELREMFGINFPNSPEIDKPFILEGWEEIPPYRRDFDTKKYSEKTYFPREGRDTNDPETYMKKKLYPEGS